MALVELDPLLKYMHGKVGDLVFRRGRNGMTIVSRAPRKKKPTSRKAQKAVKERNDRQRQLMDDAHMYARIVMADPQKKADFEKKAKRKKLSAYQLAFGSYFKTLKGEAKSTEETP
ncbi:MAG: hypothetical protein ACM3XO_21640 [Bacteroidota bacterium]